MILSDHRTSFIEAANYFIETTSLVARDQWSLPGLGQWTAQELAGHASRALVTIKTYLNQPGTSADLANPVAYFLSAFASGDSTKATSQAIADRGKEAGSALGIDPLKNLQALHAEIIEALDAFPDDAILTTPMGTIRLSNYLPTRTFELVIHTLDIARAIGITPTPPLAPLTDTVILAAALAAQQGHGVEVCLSLTGRAPLGPEITFI